MVLTSNMLHNIGPDACAQLIAAAAAAEALAPGGRLVLQDLEATYNRTAPSGGLRFALLMALCSKGGAVLHPGVLSLGQAGGTRPRTCGAPAQRTRVLRPRRPQSLLS